MIIISSINNKKKTNEYKLKIKKEMDKNTVFLSVEEYNELRDFKKETLNGNVLVEYRSYGLAGGSRTSYYTNDEVAKELGEQKDSLKEEVKKLKEEIAALKKTLAAIDAPKPITVDDIKNMSYWQFRKWKRG